MSDTQSPVSSSMTKGTQIRQKIFNIIGWLAFLLLIPAVLQMFNYPKLQELITSKIGGWGSPFAAVLYLYALLFLRVFFGSDQRLTPIIMGYVVSFVLFSNSLDIGFMKWLRDLTSQVEALATPYISFVVGIIVIFVSNALSSAKKCNWIVDTLLLVIIPFAAVYFGGVYIPGLFA